MSVTEADPYRHLEPPLRRLAAMGPDDPQRAALRNELAVAFSPLIRNIARRFAASDQPMEDLEQVATIGMLKALDRYRLPTVGDPIPALVGYAAPTISGEIRRHLRDTDWAVHVPRPIKEVWARLWRAAEAHTAENGRAPRPSELADRLGVDVDLVIDALQASYARRPASTDIPADGSGERLADRLPQLDTSLADIDRRGELRQAMQLLSAREARIIALRFFEDRTQVQIAHELGISQMHVSRLLNRTLHVLRDHVVR